MGVRVRGPGGALVLYPAALTEMRDIERDMIVLGTQCLHRRAITSRTAAAAAAAAAAAPAASSFNLDEDGDDGAVGVDRAALLEDLYEAEVRWQAALRGLTSAYLAVGGHLRESGADSILNFWVFQF